MLVAVELGGQQLGDVAVVAGAPVVGGQLRGGEGGGHLGVGGVAEAEQHGGLGALLGQAA